MACEKKVIALLKGGLGNQLFIYAAARAFALKNNAKLYLDAESGFYRDPYKRNYRLSSFLINAEVLSSRSVLAGKLRRPQLRFSRAINKIFPKNRRSYLAQDWNSDPSQLTGLQTLARSVLLVGYWQEEGYFEAIENIFREEIKIPLPASSELLNLGESMRSCDSVFIHFRRNDFPYLIDYQYYQHAVDECKSVVQEPMFFLFGDETEEGRKLINFNGAPVKTVSDQSHSELDDLWLMTCCKHGIIANSSFSWWAAWLSGGAPHQKVWAPLNMGWSMKPSKKWNAIHNELVKV